MGIQSGKISVIYDDDPRLADVWKGNVGDIKSVGEVDGFGGGGGEMMAQEAQEDQRDPSSVI